MMAILGVTQKGDLNFFIQSLFNNNIFVMKKQFGIDLSALSEAQRKMCVNMLAKNNVTIDQKNNQYVATLKIPTQKVNQFYKSSEKKQNIKKSTPTIPTYTNGKKPLNRAIKTEGLEKLIELHPFVEIYIYPKKMSLLNLQQVIQNTYHSYWMFQKSTKSHQPLLNFLYQSISKQFQSKVKIDQFIVNFFQSLNYQKQKCEGVKLFHKFISERYNVELLSYFLVLRALLQEVTGEKILDLRSKSSINNGYCKMKWNPYEGELEEECIKQFLSVISTDKDTFSRITKFMYFSQAKKNNYIEIFQLFDFLIDEFAKPVDQVSEKLQLSYSHNSSSLQHEMFYLTSHRKAFSTQPLQTEFKVNMEPLIQQIDQDSPNTIDEQIRKEVGQKFQDMCIKMQINEGNRKDMLAKVNACVDSILEGDKTKWIEAVGIEGNESELYYIENVQRQYYKLKQSIKSAVVLNSFTKKVINGPGIRKMFCKHVSF